MTSSKRRRSLRVYTLFDVFLVNLSLCLESVRCHNCIADLQITFDESVQAIADSLGPARLHDDFGAISVTERSFAIRCNHSLSHAIT